VDYGPYPAKCVAVHDGDTITFDIDVGFGHMVIGQSWDGKTQMSCRVYGINAPELRTQEGKDALVYARMLIKPGDRCTLLSKGWDKYGGRYDGVITLPDGSDFAQAMIAAGHAVPMSL